MSQTPADDVDRYAVVQSTLISNFDLIKFADRKAQFLLRIALAIFAAAFIGIPPTVIALQRFLESSENWKFALFIVVILLYVFCAGCLLTAMTKLVAVIRPRTGTVKDTPSSLFFGSVAQMDPQQFRKLILEIGADEALDEMIKQTYHTAIIAQHKYQKLNQSISWMLGGGLIGVAFALILLVSVGLGSSTKELSLPRTTPAPTPMQPARGDAR